MIDFASIEALELPDLPDIAPGSIVTGERAPKRKKKRMSVDFGSLNFETDESGNLIIDTGDMLLTESQARELKEYFIVISERKAQGFDVFLNKQFSTKGGKKLNDRGMESELSARKLALATWARESGFNTWGKAKKYTKFNFIQEEDEVEQAPMASVDMYATANKRPHYIVPEWKDVVVLKYLTGYYDKDYTYHAEGVNLSSSTVIRVGYPLLMKLWVAAVRRQYSLSAPDNFIPMDSFEKLARQCKRGVTATDIGKSFCRRLGKHWNRNSAMWFVECINRLQRSIRINLALQSVLVEKLGKPYLPYLGSVRIPSRNEFFNVNELPVKEEIPFEESVTPIWFISDFFPSSNLERLAGTITKHEEVEDTFRGKVIYTYVVPGNGWGNNMSLTSEVVVEDIPLDKDLWEMRTVELSGVKTNLLCFKKEGETKGETKVIKQCPLVDLKIGDSFSFSYEIPYRKFPDGTIQNESIIQCSGKVLEQSSEGILCEVGEKQKLLPFAMLVSKV